MNLNQISESLMTIDKKQLVELLVEKTSMNEEEIKTQLDQLIERILDAAKRGKALEIKEFGVFYFNEQGELRFDPADELSTEISFKYAGMKPVELKPERDTSIPVEEETEADVEDEIDETEGEDEDDPFATPFEEPEIDGPEETEEVIKKSEKTEEEEDLPFDFDDQEDDSKEEEGADEDFIPDPFSDEVLEPLEEPGEEEKKRRKIEGIKSISRQPVKKKDNTGVFILIAIVIIAVLIGGYFYYIGTQSQSTEETVPPTTNQMEPGVNESDDTGSDPLDPAESQTDGQETTPDQEMADGNQATSEQVGSNQSTDDEIVSDAGVSASETNQPLYGLNGTIIEEANNGYSIVVHSFRSETNALEAAEQLREDDYRVFVSSRTVYENQVWRVSVGQFETIGDAQQATTQLPAPYNTQNFIQRIRIN